MKRNIMMVPDKHKTYNCYDNNIISVITRFWGRDIYQYFLDDFNFKIDATNYSNIYKVATGTMLSKILLEDFAGIKLKYIKNEKMSVKEFWSIINSEFYKGKIVGIITDAFDCPWNRKYFHLSHMEHAFIICGYDEKKERINCIDGFYSIDIESISLEELHEMAWYMIIFEQCAYDYDKAISKIDYYLKQGLLVNKDYPRKEEVIKYIHIIQGMNFDEEVQRLNNDIQSSYLIFAITDITNSRYNFYNTMLYNRNHNYTNISMDIIDDLNKLCVSWECVKNYMIKSFYIKNIKFLNRALEKMSEIADQESYILDKITGSF